MPREDVSQLESVLAAREFGCLTDGVHHIHAVYQAVKRDHAALCDDNYLCSQNCGSGHNTPEWQHAVRRALDRAKRRGGRIWKPTQHGHWGFGPRLTPAPMNVAFKMTWVYGDDGPWSSPCGPEGRRTNVLKERKTWCMQKECKCSRYVHTDKRLPRDLALSPCLDYRAPHQYCFASGVFHHGPRQGEEIPMKGTAVGRFAFLTSRRCATPETERIILACFRIDHLGPVPGLGQYAVTAEKDSPCALTLPLDRLDEAPRFWDFRPKAVPRDWRTGLFRYVPDAEADAMREAVAGSCGDIDPSVWHDTEAIRQEEEYVEGRRSERLGAQYERNPRLRSAAIQAHGTRCQVCGFDFRGSYGELGAGFIEVHHFRPVSSYEGEVRVDPRKDVGVVCPNCHRMIHRRPDQPLTIEQLRRVLAKQQRR